MKTRIKLKSIDQSKVGLIGEIIEEQWVSNVTDDNAIYRDEKLDITMCPSEETYNKTFEKKNTEEPMQVLTKCNKTTVNREEYSKVSLVKKEDQTVEVRDEIKSSKVTVEPEMQDESEALAALDAVVCKTSVAVSELTQNATITSCIVKEPANEPVSSIQEIEPYSPTTEPSSIERKISVPTVKRVSPSVHLVRV